MAPRATPCSGANNTYFGPENIINIDPGPTLGYLEPRESESYRRSALVNGYQTPEFGD